MSGNGSLSGPGRLSGPGSLGDASTQPAGAATVRQGLLVDEPLAQYATRHGLKPSAARPPLFSYIAQIWQRRHFVVGFATARNVAMYTEARLGQLWQVLTPLLNAGVYFLIFGVLLGTNRGFPAGLFLPFLVTGVFVFNYTQRSILVASRVMHDSLPLIRALHFPRACLPLGYVIIELQQLLLSFAVLFLIVLGTGEPFTWYWLLILPVLALQTLFNVGASLIVARWGAGFDDVSQLLPFLVRTWMYTSGVLFSLQALSLTALGALRSHPTIAYLLQINPAAVYITLIRYALLANERAITAGTKPYNYRLCQIYRVFPVRNPYNVAYCHPIVTDTGLWLWGVGWAVLALVIGFIFFWRAEVRYGRG